MNKETRKALRRIDEKIVIANKKGDIIGRMKLEAEKKRLTEHELTKVRSSLRECMED